MVFLTEISQLSDDDEHVAANPSSSSRGPPTVPHPKASSTFDSQSSKRKSLSESRSLASARSALRAVTAAKCRCKTVQCRSPFRANDAFEQLLNLRLTLRRMDKQAADQEARI